MKTLKLLVVVAAVGLSGCLYVEVDDGYRSRPAYSGYYAPSGYNYAPRYYAPRYYAPDYYAPRAYVAPRLERQRYAPRVRPYIGPDVRRQDRRYLQRDWED